MSGNYPAGVTDNDPHFDLPSGDANRVGKRTVTPPTTTMVYCSPCMTHWKAPAREDYWNARVELCPKRHLCKGCDGELTNSDLEMGACTQCEQEF